MIKTFTLLGALCGCPSLSFAQDSGADFSGSQEIIVTAQKREQSVNTVPISIVAATGDQLVSRGIHSVTDLPRLVPGFTVQEGAFNSTSFTLRGIGFYNSDLSTPPTVTVYSDEAPLPYPAMTKLVAFDLERVEVLKGPQGTLFGQNATAGLINYIAAKPSSTFEAGIDASFGRFNRAILGGFVSGPLSDAVSARLAVQAQRGDAWQYSITRPGDKMGRIRQLQGRATVDFHPDGPWSSRLTIMATHDGSDPLAAQYIGNAPVSPAQSPPGFLAFPIVEKTRAADWTPTRFDTGTKFPYAQDNNLFQISWRNDYDLSDEVTLTSLTSYSSFHMAYGQDTDGTPYHINEVIDNDGRISNFYQELRVAGTSDRFNWLIGANYTRDRVSDQQLNFFSDKDACAPQPSDSEAFCDVGLLTGRMKVNTFGIFAKGEFEISPALTFEGSARYNIDRRSFNNCAIIVSDHYARFWNIVRGGASPASQIGDCYILDAQNLPNTVDNVHKKLNDNTLSWRAGVNFKPQANMLLYATVGKGFKAGTVPVVGAATTDQLVPVPSESVLAYEGGMKAGLLDRKVQLNISGFYYDYSKKQLRGSLLDPLFGPLEALVSIPKSHAYGAELQLTVAPVRGLVVDSSVTYVRTKIDEFTGFDTFAQWRDLAGTAFPFSPKWQSVTNIDYTFAASSSAEIFIGSTITSNSKTFAGVGGKDAFFAGGVNAGPGVMDIKGYTLIDLRAGVDLDDGRLRIWAWGKNVTDKYYWNTVFPYGNAISRYVGQPATYGVSLSYRYK